MDRLEWPGAHRRPDTLFQRIHLPGPGFVFLFWTIRCPPSVCVATLRRDDDHQGAVHSTLSTLYPLDSRIPLPMTVEEFQIGQLYSVAEASKEATTGKTAIEILVNEPFEDPVMGKGQFTHKIYHIAG